MRSNRLNEDLFVVVAEHQDVRQLDGRVAAHAHTRRDALNDSLFRRTDGGNGTGRIIISIQIDHADQSRTDGAVLQRALHIDKGILEGFKNALLQIFLHGLVDQRRVCGLLRRAELGLREDQIDGRRSALGVLTHALPICGVGGELVAGDDRPFFHGIYLRKKNISRQKCVHDTTAFQKSFVIYGKPLRIL